MSIQVYEGFPSRESVTGGNNPSTTLNWIALGSSDEASIKVAVMAATPVVCGGLVRQDIRTKEVAPETWECQTSYGVIQPPKANEYKFAFDTSGGKQKITHSRTTIRKYGRQGRTAPDHQGAIGVTDHGVEGCEIVVPQFSWSETWQLPIANYGWAYAMTLSDLTGKLNSDPFRGFPSGEVLFLGGKGSASNKDPSLIEITYAFARQGRVDDAIIGDITGIQKVGWEYLWVHYQETDDPVAKHYVHRPDSAYVEVVYESDDFSTLGIGN